MNRTIAGCSVLIALIVSLPSELVRGEDKSSAITLQSLLHEMVDRNEVVRMPASPFVCKQASSYDRRKRDTFDARTWHSNDDHDQFLHTELNEGRREWVIMEDAGPGAITRIWTPLAGDRDRQTVRFYFDGASKPGIVVNFNEMLSGRGFVKPPLAFIAWSESDLANQLKPDYKPRRGCGGDCYLPIPYAKSCKVTLDSVPFYYHVNYRSYAPSTRVETFSMAQFEASKETVEKVSLELLNASKAENKNSEPVAESEKALAAPAKSETVEAGQELAIDLPTSTTGAAAIRSLVVHVDPAEAGQALRSTVVSATFDDKTTVWCPLSEFFGTGVRLDRVADWDRQVAADGNLTAKWVMPYQKSARISLKNLGKTASKLSLSVAAYPWQWDDRSLYFHARWRCQLDLKTQPRTDWNYIEIEGQGRYVGDTLTVFAPVKQWYGEGDERIYYDGATFPAHIGTGTEDYYGYAWGMTGFFSSPFISMPHREHAPKDDWRGYTTTSRVRLLDDIPFQTSLRHDMEIWHWANTQVDYAAGTFWYARLEAKDNRPPQSAEAAAAIRLSPK